MCEPPTVVCVCVGGGLLNDPPTVISSPLETKTTGVLAPASCQFLAFQELSRRNNPDIPPQGTHYPAPSLLTLLSPFPPVADRLEVEPKVCTVRASKGV